MRISTKTARLTLTALFAALAALLYFVEIPIVAFYKLDLSGIPVLFCGFTLGPLPALAVLVFKNLVHVPFGGTMGVGEIADLLMLGTLMLTSTLIYRRNEGFKSALIGLILGTVLMSIVGGLANYFMIIPFYVRVAMPMDAIISAGNAAVPWVDSLVKLIIAITIPFNLLKGVVLGAVSLILLRHLKPVLKKQIG